MILNKACFFTAVPFLELGTENQYIIIIRFCYFSLNANFKKTHIYLKTIAASATPCILHDLTCLFVIAMSERSR